MDDLLLEKVEEVEEKENIVNDPEDVIEEESINEFKREEIKLNEGKQDNFTDVSILGSNASNNLRSVTSFDLDGYDRTTLWNNNDPNVSFSEQNIIFNDNILNYDIIGICFNSTEKDYILYVNSKDLYNSNSSENYIIGGGGYYRKLYKVNDNTILITQSYLFSRTSLANNKCIPKSIEGYKRQEVVIPEPTPTPEGPTTSGNGVINNITNNYYCTVSDDSLSYNMLNKPLNKYTTGESYIAFGTLMFLGIGLYLIIRRSIFKWH